MSNGTAASLSLTHYPHTHRKEAAVNGQQPKITEEVVAYMTNRICGSGACSERLEPAEEDL